MLRYATLVRDGQATAEGLPKLETGQKSQPRSAATATDEARAEPSLVARIGTRHGRVCELDGFQTQPVRVATQDGEHPV